jgi:hypothetical protein
MFAAPTGHEADRSANNVAEDVESNVEDEISCEVDQVSRRLKSRAFRSRSYLFVFFFRTEPLPRQTS